MNILKNLDTCHFQSTVSEITQTVCWHL